MSKNINILNDFLDNIEPKLSENATSLLRPLISVLHLPKKYTLVRENQYCHKIFVILEGASRSFYLEKGIEVHTWFAFENEVIGSLRNFNNLASRENIELIEDSVLISFDIPQLKSLMKNQIEVLQFVNETILEHALFLEDKLFYMHMKSAKEKFLSLQKREPEIFKRVPLTYIASYLGISRETLSRLRSK